MARLRLRRSTVLYLASLLGGGLLPGECEVRVHDAVINGSKSYFAGLFDPSNVSGFPFDSFFPESQTEGDAP